MPQPSSTSSNESTRTLIFVAVAVVSIVLAAMAEVFTRPKPLEDFGQQLGEEFFADFDDPSGAKSLKVVVYDEDTASIRDFEVQQQANGLWTIPSHHNYPADAEDRLSETAASVIGITRGALQSRRESDHERYGVIDPLDPEVTQLKGRGQRITLSSADETTLADLIVGNEVDGREGYFYVRDPKEKETYIAKVEIDLSTKFADWVERDLLKVERDDITEVVVNKYSIDEQQQRLTDQEVNKLTREKFSDPWALDGLKEDTEEVDKDKTREMVSSLDDLKLVGVRPKPEGLNPDLTVDAKLARNPLVIQSLRSDLASRGFYVVAGRNEDDGLSLLANEGELHAATNEGIVYDLYFGEIFTGTDAELETGFTKNDKDEAGDKKDEDPDAGDDGEQGDGDEAKEDDDEIDTSDLKSSRYLFVRARFDEKYLGTKPVKPEEPTEPELPEEAESSESNAQGDAEPASDDDAADEQDSQPEDAKASGDGADQDAEEDSGSDNDEEKADDSGEGDEKDEQKEEESEADKLKREYEEAKKKYESDLTKYESDLADYERKIEDGQKKAEELNARFGEWYYVISNESFEKLRLSRDQLVKEKEKKEDEADDGNKDGETSSSDEPPFDDDKSDKDKPEKEADPADKADDSKDAPESDNSAADSKPADDTEAKPDEKSEAEAAPKSEPESSDGDDKSDPKPDAPTEEQPSETPSEDSKE